MQSNSGKSACSFLHDPSVCHAWMVLFPETFLAARVSTVQIRGSVDVHIRLGQPPGRSRSPERASSIAPPWGDSVRTEPPTLKSPIQNRPGLASMRQWNCERTFMGPGAPPGRSVTKASRKPAGIANGSEGSRRLYPSQSSGISARQSPFVRGHSRENDPGDGRHNQTDHDFSFALPH